MVDINNTVQIEWEWTIDENEDENIDVRIVLVELEFQSGDDVNSFNLGPIWSIVPFVSFSAFVFMRLFLWLIIDTFHDTMSVLEIFL